MNAEKLTETLEKHLAWLKNEDGGEKADLRGADLRGANLWGADLREANLREANLWGADGSFALGYFGKHHAIAAGEYISIGCERHTYQEWMDHYTEIGKDYEYTAAEIERYGAWIKLAVAWLNEVEKVEA
jgi:uncharacterized protein YjbI with pentapeptide repeats